MNAESETYYGKEALPVTDLKSMTLAEMTGFFKALCVFQRFLQGNCIYNTVIVIQTQHSLINKLMSGIVEIIGTQNAGNRIQFAGAYKNTAQKCFFSLKRIRGCSLRFFPGTLAVF